MIFMAYTSCLSYSILKFMDIRLCRLTFHYLPLYLRCHGRSKWIQPVTKKVSISNNAWTVNMARYDHNQSISRPASRLVSDMSLSLHERKYNCSCFCQKKEYIRSCTLSLLVKLFPNIAKIATSPSRFLYCSYSKVFVITSSQYYQAAISGKPHFVLLCVLYYYIRSDKDRILWLLLTWL